MEQPWDNANTSSPPLQSQPGAPNMMKPGPNMLQSLPPPNTFSVQAQGPPPLLQAQLSAASLAPLLQNPPPPLLSQPPPKGRGLYDGD